MVAMSNSPWEVFHVQIQSVSLQTFKCWYLADPPKPTPRKSKASKSRSIEDLPTNAETWSQGTSWWHSHYSGQYADGLTGRKNT